MEVNYHYITENFSNFLVQYQRGKLRQINDYYPYGLSIHGINAKNEEYLNKYTGKELHMIEMSSADASFDSSSSRHLYYSFAGGTGEFDPSISTGLEMLAPSGRAILIDADDLADSRVTFTGFDFHARFEVYPEPRRRDPQLGRPALSEVEVWFTPDPATVRESVRTMQFHNPFIGIGNNPVMYVDPDGEFIMTAMVIGAFVNLTVQGLQGNTTTAGGFFGSMAVGAAAGAIGAGVGAGVQGAIQGVGFMSPALGKLSVMPISGFLNGAAVGGASGFAGGFVTGFGNTGVQGGNIGDMFSTGLDYGWKGAASGILIGGLNGGISAELDGRSFLTGNEKPKVYKAPVQGTNASGKTSGECAYRCLSENAKSLGVEDADFNYWVKLNGQKVGDNLGVKTNKIADLINNSEHFTTDGIQGGVKFVENSMAKNQRVIAMFGTERGGHAVNIRKLKVWPDGRFKMFFADPSPVRLAPYKIDDLVDIPGIGFINQYLK